MGTYRRSDGQQRRGFDHAEARQVQDLLFAIGDNARNALDYIDGEDTNVDGVESELQHVKTALDTALDRVLAVLRRGEKQAGG